VSISEVTDLKESNKAKGKAAIKQDLENTLSFYNETLTKKAIRQLFDEYVKEDEDSYYTNNSHKIEYYDNDNDYNYVSDNTSDGLYDSDNSDNNGGFYFGNTFSNFEKDNLITDYDNSTEYNYDTNDSYNNSYDELSDEYEQDSEYSENNEKNYNKSNYEEPAAPTVEEEIHENKNEYYEYDDFDDDFDQYDYEPKKKKKPKPIKIKPKRRLELGEYEDFLDKKRKERDALKDNDFEPQPVKSITKQPKKSKNPKPTKRNKVQKDPVKETEYNIFIKDLTVPNEENDEMFYTQNLPPLKENNIPQRDIGYEDVLRYSPRRRGGRNQTVKKKKRIPLNENKNLYPDGVSHHAPKRKNQTQKSKIIIHSPKAKKRKSKLPLLTTFFIFILIGSLIFCVIKIKNLSNEIEILTELLNPSTQQQSLPENNNNSDPNENPI